VITWELRLLPLLLQLWQLHQPLLVRTFTFHQPSHDQLDYEGFHKVLYDPQDLMNVNDRFVVQFVVLFLQSSP
jgi:hypothetical protein